MNRSSRRGRPPGTSRRALELIALRLFTERGFDNTTVTDIATEAGISERSFFRYFPSKGEVLWHQFDDEVAELRAAFDAVPDSVPLMTAVRRVVVGVNHYRAEDVPELRTRMRLIGTVPALSAGAGAHYDAWERAIGDFAAQRLGTEADDLLPMAIGRTALAAARAAFDAWLDRADADLQTYLDRALGALERGFAPEPADDPGPPRLNSAPDRV